MANAVHCGTLKRREMNKLIKAYFGNMFRIKEDNKNYEYLWTTGEISILEVPNWYAYDAIKYVGYPVICSSDEFRDACKWRFDYPRRDKR
jgi:hypothetical protein